MLNLPPVCWAGGTYLEVQRAVLNLRCLLASTTLSTAIWKATRFRSGSDAVPIRFWPGLPYMYLWKRKAANLIRHSFFHGMTTCRSIHIPEPALPQEPWPEHQHWMPSMTLEHRLSHHSSNPEKPIGFCGHSLDLRPHQNVTTCSFLAISIPMKQHHTSGHAGRIRSTQDTP